MLEIANVSVTFLRGTPDERLAVDGLSLRLDEGAFVTIIGGNGAGKSTLFNLICGAARQDSGGVALDGRALDGIPEHRRARDIGRLYQDPLKGTAPGMTIEENLSLACMRGKRRGLRAGMDKKNREWFRERLAQLGLGLEDRMKTRVGLLSGGQRQAITLLMATMSSPKLLLLDEHTAALDPATADKVLRLTCDIVREQNITTMMITHNIASSLQIGSRTLMMDSGRIVWDIAGEERAGMSVEDVMRLFRERGAREMDNDRMLLS